MRGPVTALSAQRLAAALLQMKAFFAQLLRQVAATKAVTGPRTPRITYLLDCTIVAKINALAVVLRESACSEVISESRRRRRG